jgi:hypothetical protein
LPEPEELAADAIAELEAAVEELNSIVSMLQDENNGGPKPPNENAIQT